jgi:hypothetical protein
LTHDWGQNRSAAVVGPNIDRLHDLDQARKAISVALIELHGLASEHRSAQKKKA